MPRREAPGWRGFRTGRGCFSCGLSCDAEPVGVEPVGMEPVGAALLDEIPGTPALRGLRTGRGCFSYGGAPAGVEPAGAALFCTALFCTALGPSARPASAAAPAALPVPVVLPGAVSPLSWRPCADAIALSSPRAGRLPS
ncbi:hypothetical protein Misp03_12420 [Microbispora sp. NBRC 16548]|nr:hypothetical protein Misp03_12420 [Microbispora sp. NBRC 16548]